jgi:hypothetical protein
MKRIIANKRLLIIALVSLLYNTAGAQKLTYHKNIASIIKNKCLPCHRAGEAAPFSLASYQDVVKRGSFIKEVVRSGYMPPWKPDNAYRTFHNDRSLSASEKDMIIKWVNDKMPEGSASKNSDRSEAQIISGTQYNRKPDATLQISKPFIIKGDNEERFIVFKIPFDFAAERNVEAIEFISNNKKVIHHANFAIHPVSDNIDINQAADYVDLSGADRSAYDQYLPFKAKMDYYGGWIPGTSFESYPKDLGWVMPKRGVMLLTIHYAPSGKDEEDLSGVNFFFKDTPIKRQVSVVSLGSAGVGEKDIEPYFMIPGGEKKSFNLKIVTPKDQSLLYVWPHMHLLGKTFKSYAVTPEQDTIPLISIPSWDFKWQEIYRFKKLVKIPKGSVLTIEAFYDNTKENPNNPSDPPRMVFSANDMKTTDEMMTMLMVFLNYEDGDEQLELDN